MSCLKLFFISCSTIYIWQCLLIWILTNGLYIEQCHAITYRVGILLAEPCTVDFSASVNETVNNAVQLLNDRNVTNSIDFTFSVFPYCDEIGALADINTIFGPEYDAIIGVTSYLFHTSFAAFSDLYKKTYIAANSFIWTRVTDYAFTASNSFHQSSLLLGQLLDNFKWQGVVSITTDHAYWHDFTTELYIQLNLNDFHMKKNVAVKSPVSYEEAIITLQSITDSEKAVVLCMNVDDQRIILQAAANLSLGLKHAFFTFASSRYDVEYESLLGLSVNDINSFGTSTYNIMESVFVITPHFPDVHSDLIGNVRTKRFADPSAVALKDTYHEEERTRRAPIDSSTYYFTYLSSIYDSVLVLAYTLDDYLMSNNNSFNESVNIINYISNISFNGSVGLISIDKNALTLYSYYVYDYSIFSGQFEPKISLKATGPTTWDLTVEREINWPSNTRLHPDACFKMISGCTDGDGLSTSYIIILFVVAVVILLVGTIVFVFVRRYIARNEMKRGPHKLILQPSDLTFLLRKDMGKGSRGVMKSALLDKPDLVKASEPNKSSTSLTELSDYTDTARFNGDLVHVKELSTKGFEMKSRMMDYMKSLRDLRHENINPYVGLLVDPVKPALVTEYCSRGSLQDVIRNEDIKLDWDFKYSLIIDLVRGLRYLHNSSLKWHGYLKSTNCVIDSRWVLKLTDYGLPGFLGRAKQTREQSPVDLLWSAPECLRAEGTPGVKGSEKADVFSFAIIMQEVALRSDPYSTTGLTPQELIRKVKKPPPLIRPSVSPQFAPPPYIQLMKQCWSESPDMRPGIEEIYDQFKKITSGKKANIVDTMFRMLEKYSNDLEEIVNERTVQLEEEKKKTDQLLSRMLPPAVAEYLKVGKPVEAETFAEVTIYFSDIVGFTTISAMSTPMQVVDLLNDLYTMFDATIEQYDVYKVETIGDAYMVVSGLPTRIGYKHAGEISTMALDLLSQCGTFSIRHMPDVPLRLRIGLHTGPCVAGVVGLTMPRYCLFGDTVNTASRMESTGCASRIHVSEETKEVLYVLGGYKLEFRGMVELKGKGKRPTYWLTGKEGFEKPLPNPPEAGEDNHGLASVLSVDNLTTMINNDSPSAATKPFKAPSPIPESNNEQEQTSTDRPENASNSTKNDLNDSRTSSAKSHESTVQADIELRNCPDNSSDSKSSDLTNTSPPKVTRKISPSALSLSDSNIHNNNEINKQYIISSQSTDNIPKSKATNYIKNDSSKIDKSKNTAKRFKMTGKSGSNQTTQANENEGSLDKSKVTTQLNHLDETIKTNSSKFAPKKGRRTPTREITPVNAKNEESFEENNEIVEQRLSEISVSTVISVVSTSDIDVSKSEKCQNDPIVPQNNSSSSPASELPPVSNV